MGKVVEITDYRLQSAAIFLPFYPKGKNGVTPKTAVRVWSASPASNTGNMRDM